MNEYQVMPPLSDEEYAELKSDIAARGVQQGLRNLTLATATIIQRPF